jgi:cephalosporin hydroxylase
MTKLIPPPEPVKAYQNMNEFTNLWDFVVGRGSTRILEIGALFGGTLWYWSQVPGLELLVSVDLPVGPEREDIYDDIQTSRTLWADWFPETEFHDIQGNSHDKATVKQVESIIGKGLFDFAFIDGDHSYEGVKRDFELYKHLVKPGGIIAFHDTVQNGFRYEPGVVQFVGEIKWTYPWVEFFHWDGAGICAFVMEDERP